MGIYNAFKRWRLSSRGMSSGTRRRIAKDNTLADSLGSSTWVQAMVLIVFLVVIVLINLIYPGKDALFHNDSLLRVVVTLVCSMAIILLFLIGHQKQPKNSVSLLIFGGLLFHVLLLKTIIYIIELREWEMDYLFLLTPLALVPMVHSVLLKRYYGIFSSLGISLLGGLIIPSEDAFYFLVMSLTLGCITVLLTRMVNRRGSLLRAGFYTGLTMLFLATAFHKINLPLMLSGESISTEVIKMLLALVVGLLTGMVVSGLLPVFEVLFNITTNISWLEMSDLNHKLLRKLQLSAPGTYHHSMVVATLSETAAEKVGANAFMCRVCSYFHDIGKINKPDYFVENQGQHNPHDDLTPTMSAIIIIAHVKDGIDMAIKNKLNPKIIQVIREHHGNSLVRYFYYKAIEDRKLAQEEVSKGIEKSENVPEVDPKGFRYPGPIPGSKESAIISLADCVESATRTIKKPTPEKIRNMVNELIMERVTSGQLDNSELTLGNIKDISDSFTNTLRSMMHNRIDYPSEKEKRNRKQVLKPRSSANPYVELKENS